MPVTRKAGSPGSIPARPRSKGRAPRVVDDTEKFCGLYKLSLALAGFTPEQITVMPQQNRLTVTGTKGDNGKEDYIYQSIAARPFERNFSLADHVEVEGATFDNGVLHIDLVRRVPEPMKPRRVEIGAGSATVRDTTTRAIKAA
jgi:HSP20 family molecular chaperone IbpA